MLFFSLRAPIQTLFLSTDAEAKAAMGGGLWPLLCAAQVLNAIVFVQDGILAAAHAWVYGECDSEAEAWDGREREP